MKIIKLILISVIAVFMLSSFLYLEKTIDAFGHIITFLSIITGFCITALSIIASSNFAKALYKKEDPKDNSKTLLHNLTNMFANCILSATIGIVLILSSFYLSVIDFCKYEFCDTFISFKTVLIGTIWYLTIFSIIQFVNLVFMFLKFVIQSAKNQ